MRYIFGPVPSRRLGMSLGIDMVPYKTCTFDCVYCECGQTTVKESARRDYFGCVEPVIAQVQQVLSSGVSVDYVTLSGSGEPTLNLRCGEVIEAVKRLSSRPVAVLTNGSLLTRDDVFEELLVADVVVPSLDAARQETFQRINRPLAEFEIESIVDAIGRFSRAFKGQVWLEVLLVEGLNDTDEEIEALRRAVDRIEPDVVQVGTVDRPGAERWARPVCDERLAFAVSALGPRAALIGGPARRSEPALPGELEQRVLALVLRRPCTLSDIETSVGVKRPIVLKALAELVKAGRVEEFEHEGRRFYLAVRG